MLALLAFVSPPPREMPTSPTTTPRLSMSVCCRPSTPKLAAAPRLMAGAQRPSSASSSGRNDRRPVRSGRLDAEELVDQELEDQKRRNIREKRFICAAPHGDRIGRRARIR